MIAGKQLQLCCILGVMGRQTLSVFCTLIVWLIVPKSAIHAGTL